MCFPFFPFLQPNICLFNWQIVIILHLLAYSAAFLDHLHFAAAMLMLFYNVWCAQSHWWSTFFWDCILKTVILKFQIAIPFSIFALYLSFFSLTSYYLLLGCSKNWCLMCELEQYASTLRESGGPLSPSRILSNLRNIGCRLGGGTQEDAHEFLR